MQVNLQQKKAGGGEDRGWRGCEGVTCGWLTQHNTIQL